MESLTNLVGANSALSQPNAMSALLEQMGSSDPRVQMILEYMRSQPAPQAESADEERRTRIRRARASYERLKEEHAILRERNDILAAALGACPYCWGEAEDCEACHGRGRPGVYQPDKDAFMKCVMPVVRRLGFASSEGRAGQRDAVTERDADTGGRRTQPYSNKEV